MKAKVIIENGKTKIVLEAENVFERDLIEHTVEKKYEVVETNVFAEYSFSTYKDHRIIISIETKK